METVISQSFSLFTEELHLLQSRYSHIQMTHWGDLLNVCVVIAFFFST